MTTPCAQTDRIKTLELNQDKIMEILTEIKQDIKEVKKFLFEWPLEEKFVPKEIFDLTINFFKEQLAQREKDIADLRRNQNKVAWLIISTVLLAIIWLVVVPKVF